MRTIIYVDGFNLYYGALKGTSYKWLDPHPSRVLLQHATFIKKIRSGPLQTSQFPAQLTDANGHFRKPVGW